MDTTRIDDGSARQGQPPGLYVLFGAEAWERFSYYGMRALLVLYLTSHLHYARSQALAVYGMYTGLVYLTPLLGGLLADKVLGRRKAVLIGGLVMALGHLAMAFEPLLHLALGLLIVGNGFFKPNISTMVGGLFSETDTRRDGAFTIFYMGINLGAFFSPIVCGTLGEKLGWHYGFSAAAIGMVAGISVFALMQRHLGTVGMPPGRERSADDVAQDSAHYRDAAARNEPTVTSGLTRRDYFSVAMWTVASVMLVNGVLLLWVHVLGPMAATLAGPVRGIGIALLAGMFYLLFRGSDWTEAQRIIVIIVLCLFNIFFWMGFEQAGGTMTLFAENQTDRNLTPVALVVTGLLILACGENFRRATRDEPSGRGLWMALTGLFVLAGVAAFGLAVRAGLSGRPFELPSSQFQAINPMLIVALAPTFSNMWNRLDQGRFRTSTPTKMAIGMVILGLGFVVMYFAQQLAGEHGRVSAIWLAAVYGLHTIGELCLSPIGLSMVTRLAPARVASLAMGLWLGSSAVANYLAGSLEGMLERSHTPIYAFLIGSSVGPALLLLALTPLLKKMMQGRA